MHLRFLGCEFTTLPTQQLVRSRITWHLLTNRYLSLFLTSKRRSVGFKCHVIGCSMPLLQKKHLMFQILQFVAFKRSKLLQKSYMRCLKKYVASLKLLAVTMRSFGVFRENWLALGFILALFSLDYCAMSNTFLPKFFTFLKAINCGKTTKSTLQ